MTPDFRIIADSVDITAAIRDRLVSLSVSDEVGITSDAAEIVLDDRGGIVELPSPGATLDISLGYVETGLIPMGLFRSDEVEISGPPDRMIIRATAIDTGGTLKEHKTRAWDDVTVQDIVETIAGEHGLTPRVAPAFAAIPYPHIDQTNESDLHLLTRLAHDHDAVAAVKGGNLIFSARGKGKSVSGEDMPKRSIIKSDVGSWRITLAERGRYKAVTASWHSVEGGEKESLTAGEGEPIFRLMHVYASKGNVSRAAKAKLASLSRAADTLSLTMPGDALVAAESPLTLSGFRQGVNGDWIAARVDHRFDGSGFSTTVDAEAPDV